MKIEVLPRTEDDVICQFRYYLFEAGAPLAERFREAVIESLKRIARYPRIGSSIRGAVPDIRCWPVKGFDAIRIYYVETSVSVRVVRILHGKRDVRRILKDD